MKDSHLILQATTSGTDSELQETKFEFSKPEEITEPVIMATNRERTLKELANPDMACQLLCIQLPQQQEGEIGYELKPGLIHLLPKSHGLPGEDPHKHLMEFHGVCSTMKSADVLEELVKMKAFPFSLCYAAKDWLYLQPSAVTTWTKMKRRFLEKLFPSSRTTSIRKEISGIRQLQGETLYKYWERFNKLCSICPNHQMSEQLFIQHSLRDCCQQREV